MIFFILIFIVTANTSDGQSHGLEDEKPSKNEIRKCSTKWWPWTKERNRNGAIGRLHRGELKNILIFLFFMCVQFMPIAYIVPENFCKTLLFCNAYFKFLIKNAFS